MMEAGIDDEKILLRKIIGKFALYSANACSDAENKKVVTSFIEQQQKDVGADGANNTSSIAQKQIIDKTTEEFHCHITLASRISTVDREVAEEFVKFLLDTYVRDPFWHPALLYTKAEKEVDRLFRSLCDTQNINRVLTTIRDFYPAGAEPFVSHLLFLTREKVFEIAADFSKNKANGNPELAEKHKRNAHACARTLKRHCDELVGKSHDVRFWCHAAAFHSPLQLRRQTIPAIVSCFDNAETVADAEAGLRNCVAATAYFMGGLDGLDRGISVSDLLEQLIVMPRNNNNVGSGGLGLMNMMLSNNRAGGLLDIAEENNNNNADAVLSVSGTASTDTTSGVNISITFSAVAQQRAIAHMIDFIKITQQHADPLRDIIKLVLDKLRQQQQHQHQQYVLKSNQDGKNNSNVSAIAFTPPLFMHTINLLLAREWSSASAHQQLRRFASTVARGLVLGEVWAHDAELWHGVQVYLEQEAKHLVALLSSSNLSNMTPAQHAALSTNQQPLLAVVQAVPRRTLKELVASRPNLKNFVKQYEELRDVLD